MNVSKKIPFPKLLLVVGLAFTVLVNLQQCGIITARQNIKNCKFSLEDISIKNLTLAGVELGLDVGIENTNPTEVILDRLDVVVFLNGKDLGFAKSNQRTEVPPGKKGLVQFQIHSTYSQLGNGLLAALKSQGEIPYELKGTAYLEFPLVGEVSFPVDVKEKIKLKK